MFIIRLVRRLGGEGTLFRRNRLLFIDSTILCVFALFWLLVSKGGLLLATTDVIPAKAGNTLITLPITSTGCGKPSLVAPGTSVNQAMLSGGITRSYVLHIPRSYLDTTAHALVLNFHGHGSTAANQEYLTGFSTLADAYDIIVVYPQGMVGPDHHTGWESGVPDAFWDSYRLERLALAALHPITEWIFSRVKIHPKHIDTKMGRVSKALESRMSLRS